MSASSGHSNRNSPKAGETKSESSGATELDAMFMGRALELAARGEGNVEPNPMVGCVIVNNGEVVGEGWHRKFGGPHAEVEALRVAGGRTRGATAYVSLEPCCHTGKTPPCTDALIAAGVTRVVCAQLDPYQEVSGRGVAALEAAGIAVDVGLMKDEARRLNAPYLKLVTSGRPWVIAKWAMTLDGKIATRTGDSKWISGEASRAIVQQLRGRVDAIVVGHGTLERDDPLLTARPAGPRVATRVVVDSKARVSLTSQLIRTIGDAPVLVAVGTDAPQENIDRLTSTGCEVLVCRTMHSPGETNGPAHKGNCHQPVPIQALLDSLGHRRMTNVLFEGGGELLGSLLDAGAIDEVHIFVAPKLIGGREAVTAIAGLGLEKVASALRVSDLDLRHVGDDLYFHGRVVRSQT